MERVIEVFKWHSQNFLFASSYSFPTQVKLVYIATALHYFIWQVSQKINKSTTEKDEVNGECMTVGSSTERAVDTVTLLNKFTTKTIEDYLKNFLYL